MLTGLVLGALAVGIIVHGYTAAHPVAGAARAEKKTVEHDPQTPAPTVAAIPGAQDWIGFHNGGSLDGVASAIAAPPMKVRWTLKIKDLEAAEPPATAPATQPAPVIQGSGHFEGGAAIVHGVVYIADTAGAVRAINLQTGKVIWTFHSDDGFETTPLVVGGRVFLGDLGGMFFALSADTGKKIWSFDDGGNSIHASANYLVPNKNQILYATDGADIFCFDAATGKKIWNAKSGDRVNGVPAVSNGSALVSGCDSQLRAIRGKDGSEEYSVDLGAVCPGSTAVSGDNLVMGTDQGHVICISAKKHQQVWMFSQVQQDAMVYSSPAIADGIVVFGARDSNVYGVDLASGKQIWRFPTRGDVDSSPVISGGRVYVGSKDKKLYVLDLKTGKQLWSFTAGRGIAASPAIGDGALIIADEGGHLFCLE
ncbi:MAG TPA: PQQ-binding-like beta-propeller repeat protein [Tepidisphaeraceae bacterium]|jgi:outer membrane protein assembly factor BamB|nr:PQQ-binding-like beta-propeller repeat protein [Tepidisphaeraceae bacterium]